MARILIVFDAERKKYFLHNPYDFDMLLHIFFRSLVDRESVKFSDSAENFGQDGRKRLKNGFCGCLCHERFCVGTNLTEDWFVMKQTKGAIGNLLNRYKAVLKKCHLLNTFGSLAVASMLVMGGVEMVAAAEPISVQGTSENIQAEQLDITGTAEKPAISVTKNGTLEISSSNIKLAHFTYDCGGEREYKYASVFAKVGTISVTGESLTFAARNSTSPTPNFEGIGDNAAVLAGNSTMNIDVSELYVGSKEYGGDRGFRLVGADNKLTILADKIISYTGDEFVHVRNNASNSVANIGTADQRIGYFEAHTTWGKDDYGVAILQANEGGTINFYADTAIFDGSANSSGGVFGSGSYGTVNVDANTLNINGNLCGTYGLVNNISDKTFYLNVRADSMIMEGDINAGSIGDEGKYSNTDRKTEISVAADDLTITGDINAWERANIEVTSNNLNLTGKIISHDIGNEGTTPSIAISADNLTIAAADDDTNAVNAEKGNISLTANQGHINGKNAMHVGVDGTITTAGSLVLEGTDDAITGQGKLNNSGDLIFRGKTANFTGTYTQTAGNTRLESDYFGGDVKISGGSLESGIMKIASGKTTAVSGGIVTITEQLDLTQGKLSVSGGSVSVAQTGEISFGNTAGNLTIDGGSFVADASTMLNEKFEALGNVATVVNGSSGNLNLRLGVTTYTIDDYNKAKSALLGSEEKATLNFLNASLDTKGDNLVVGAGVDASGTTVTITNTKPVVADEGIPAAESSNKAISSVPNNLVQVVNNNDPKHTLLQADTVAITGSTFTAKGLQIAGTQTADAAVTLDIKGNSSITLAGEQGDFTGVVDANGNSVTTNATVAQNAALTVGLVGNEKAQNMTLNNLKVSGTFRVDGNGLDSTQVKANELEVNNADAVVAVNNATFEASNTTLSNGQMSIIDSVASLGTMAAKGGTLFVDPAYVKIDDVEDNFDTKLLVSAGSTVNIGAMSEADIRLALEQAGMSVGANFTVSDHQSVLILGQGITLASANAQIIVDDKVDAKGNLVSVGADGNSVSTGIQNTAYFGQDSLLVVNGNAISDEQAAITYVKNGSLYVGSGAKLLITDAVAGQTYTIVYNTEMATGSTNTDGSMLGWQNVQSTTDMITITGAAFQKNKEDNKGNVVVTSVRNNAQEIFSALSEEMSGLVNELYTGREPDANHPNRWDYADVNSDYQGIKFLSRATDNRFLGSDKQAAASTIESAARMAFAGAVPQMTKMASDAATNAVVNRLGFANPDNGAKAMNVDGKLVDDKALGLALWIAPLWSNQNGFGMEAGNLDYGYNANLGGISLGADYTWANNIRAGLMFNIGGGYAESAGGDLSETTNSMTFWGVGAYGGWEYNNFAVMADVSYTSTWNSVDQDLDHRMGMGDLEADIQASAISAGLRFEYKLETQYLDLIPHVGARYMSINTWGYDVDSADGTVLEGDGFQQNIWTFPVGITFSKELEMNNDWYFKPSVDFTVIPAAGDIKAKEDVRFTGLPYSTEIETQMMDYFTWQGGVGLEFGNDNMSVGVNYTLQAGQNSTGHGVFGMFRYEF